MGARLETEMKDLIAARRSGLISEAEFDAAAAYLAKHGGLPDDAAHHDEPHHFVRIPVPAQAPVAKKRGHLTGVLIIALLGLVYIGYGDTKGVARSKSDAKHDIASTKATYAKNIEKVEPKPAVTERVEHVETARVEEVSTATAEQEARRREILRKYPNVTTAERHKLCKAAISSLFFQEPSIINTYDLRSDDGYTNVELTYVRPSDGKKWSYKCFVVGNLVIWGAYDGRWRTHEDDERVLYHLERDTLYIQIQSGSGKIVSTKTFDLNEL